MKKVLKPYIFGKFSVFSLKYIKPFYEIIKLDIACLTIVEQLYLIEHNNKNFDHDEGEDDNEEEWAAPYKERNAFNLLNEAQNCSLLCNIGFLRYSFE